MKLCKDCKHHETGRHGLDWCHSPNNKIIKSLVRGQRREVTCCQDQRAVWRGFDVLNNRCGKRARWFEPKESQ
jgi:hypothetical protein